MGAVAAAVPAVPRDHRGRRGGSVGRQSPASIPAQQHSQACTARQRPVPTTRPHSSLPLHIPFHLAIHDVAVSCLPAGYEASHVPVSYCLFPCCLLPPVSCVRVCVFRVAACVRACCFFCLRGCKTSYSPSILTNSPFIPPICTPQPPLFLKKMSKKKSAPLKQPLLSLGPQAARCFRDPQTLARLCIYSDPLTTCSRVGKKHGSHPVPGSLSSPVAAPTTAAAAAPAIQDAIAFLDEMAKHR